MLVATATLAACLAALVAAHKAEAAFPGQNGRIVFSARGPDTPDQIFTIKPDGTGKKQLTNDPSTNNQTPAFSPDGKKIVFVRYDPQAGRSDIYIKALDGGLRRVTNDPAREFGPVFSPGGGRIAFAREAAVPGCTVCASPSELATVNTNGTHLRVITHTPNSAEPESPDWAPAGRRLVFTLFNFNTDGGASRPSRRTAQGSEPSSRPRNTPSCREPPFSPPMAPRSLSNMTSARTFGLSTPRAAGSPT